MNQLGPSIVVSRLHSSKLCPVHRAVCDEREGKSTFCDQLARVALEHSSNYAGPVLSAVSHQFSSISPENASQIVQIVAYTAIEDAFTASDGFV